jgi:hypothetical protein
LLINELQLKEGEVVILGKDFGYHADYNHIDILTHPDAEKDGYKLTIDWMRKHEN